MITINFVISLEIISEDEILKKLLNRIKDIWRLNILSLYHYQGRENLLENSDDSNQQKEKIAKFLNDSIRTENLSLFIGSGCSFPSVPLMGRTMQEIISEDTNTREFVLEFLTIKDFQLYIDNTIHRSTEEDDTYKEVLDYIDKIEISELNRSILNIESLIPEDNELSDKTKTIVEEFLLTFNDIEGFLSWIENGLKFEREYAKINKLKDCFNFVKKRFIDSIPLINNTLYTESESIRMYSSFYNKIFSYRTEESNKLSVFTTNYDLFNELALENNKITYTTGFSTKLIQSFDINQFKYRSVDDTNRYKDKWQPVNKEANLFKLHGSINWREKNGYLIHDNNESEELNSSNVVIYPTILKHRETAQSPYSELFREFSNTLQSPNTTLIIIGYGFGDDHINNIISQNLNNADFSLIIFSDINEINIENFYSEHKMKLNLHIIGGSLSEELQAHHFNTIITHFLGDSDMVGEKL